MAIPGLKTGGCEVKARGKRGLAKMLLDRCRDLVQDPRQPRTHTLETDEDDAEEHEYFHFHQSRGRGGHHHPLEDMSVEFLGSCLLVKNTIPLTRGGARKCCFEKRGLG